MANSLKSSILCLLLLGCYTPKKAERQLSRAAKYPDKVAAICSKMFPVIAKSDTVQNTEYDFIELECHDKIITQEKLKRDTVIKYVKRVVQVPGKTTIITNIIIDSAEIVTLRAQIKDNRAEVEKEKKRGDRYLNFTKLLGVLSIILFLLLLALVKREKRA